MAIVNRIAEFHDDLIQWRRDIHAHPETAFEEKRTSDIVAEKLSEFGIEVHRGLAETGVVGTLKGDRGDGPAIGLRADLDALDILEKNTFDHKSTIPGKMHACGHDGHTIMLLGAARYLAETRNFAGTVNFIFQPAEENEGGARVMIEEGLFDKFPVEAVFGMHNMPGLGLGEMAVRAGPFMAAFDIFEINLTGRGTHAAAPHLGIDPLVAAAQIVTALQTIASREIDPQDSVVVSVTQIHGGDAWNVIPEDVLIRGTVRAFKVETQDRAEASIRRIVDGICQASGVTAGIDYQRRYPPTINTPEEADFTASVMADVVGAENVFRDKAPKMASEDFAFMLNEKPGAYVWLGNGPGEGGCLLHNPSYDFNDDALPLGASYWARLVETRLAAG
ncbi:MAG: M20 aminoacylase family protein [Pseudomonadota bacterium]|nr:M20 aminoacylase family protein [Pseudomonadota bacterium]